MTEDKIREIYHQYYRLVMKVAVDIIHDFDYAQDICQDVFMTFLRKTDILDEERYREWFAVCAKRKALDFRKKAFQIHEKATAVEDEGENEEISKNGTARKRLCAYRDKMLNKYILKEFTGKLLKELELHNKDWYEILVRSLILEESDEEIARALGITVNNVRAKKHRLKEWIKKHYTSEYEELKPTN